MTIITGLICKDRIVLASDSQTTYRTSKQCDAKKITVLELSDARALIAQSGSELAQRAMRQLKDELRFQNCDCTVEWLQDFLLRQGWECELMMAFFYDGKPYIYTIDLLVGIPTRINSFYGAIGCGANLGSYLLGEHAKPDMQSDLGAAVLIYVVEMVKRHDAFCGGKTKLGAIRKMDSGHSLDCEIFSDEQIEQLSQAVIESITYAIRNQQTKQQRNTCT